MHDVVIVGAGTSGCVLAARPTEDPDVSVRLIEAGSRSRKLETKIPAAFSKLYRTDVDWGDSTTPQVALDGREVVFPRGRMLGGSAAMNAMMVLRGQRADYDEWAAAGCTGWSWAEVEPVFARSAESAFPLAALPEQHVLAEAFVHAAQAAGISPTENLNAADNEGVGFVPVSQRRGRRFSVLDGYLAPARRRPNLTIVTDALVTRVLFETAVRSALPTAWAATQTSRRSPRGRSFCAREQSARRTSSSSPATARASRSRLPVSRSSTRPRRSARTCSTISRTACSSARRGSRRWPRRSRSATLLAGRFSGAARSPRTSAKLLRSCAHVQASQHPTSSSSWLPSSSRTRGLPSRPSTA